MLSDILGAAERTSALQPHKSDFGSLGVLLVVGCLMSEKGIRCFRNPGTFKECENHACSRAAG